jgi:integrase
MPTPATACCSSMPTGDPLHPDTITARFNRLVDRARRPRIRLHDVRHTYATVSLDAGINPKIVSERIGHSSLAFTLQVSMHRSEGRDRDAAQMIAGLIVPKELTHQADEGESWSPK